MQSSWVPDRKVLAGGIAGLLVWIVSIIAGRYGFVIDASMQPMLILGVTTLMAYVVPPSVNDVLKRLDNELVKHAQEDPNYPNVTKP
jgi:hypothetical protein